MWMYGRLNKNWLNSPNTEAEETPEHPLWKKEAHNQVWTETIHKSITSSGKQTGSYRALFYSTEAFKALYTTCLVHLFTPALLSMLKCFLSNRKWTCVNIFWPLLPPELQPPTFSVWAFLQPQNDPKHIWCLILYHKISLRSKEFVHI